MYICIYTYIYIYVCVCMCMYVYMYMYVYVYVCMCVCVCMCIYVCICVYVYVCTYMCIYVCVCICMYMYICIYMYVCICIYVYVYMYVCVCIYVCIYVCVFIHNPIFCPAHGMVCPHLQCRCDCSNCFINSTMGVDITTYRQRIGTFHGSRYVCGQSKLCLVNFLYSVFFAASGSSCVLARLGVILLLIVCMHLVMYMMSFELYISFREPRGVYPDNTKPFPFSDCSTSILNFLHPSVVAY